MVLKHIPTMLTNSTLSPRGHALATGPTSTMRDQYAQFFSDPYHSIKNPNGMVNLGVAENYAMAPQVVRHLQPQMASLDLPPSGLNYNEGPWSTTRLRTALANHMNRYFRPHTAILEHQVLIANGVTALCDMLGQTLFSSGEGILLTRPCYQSFPDDFGSRSGVLPVFVSFEGQDQFEPSAVTFYEKTLSAAREQGISVRAMLLCNPHNPLGECYSKSTLIALMKFCQKHRIHLISDEVYACSVYDNKRGEPFTSVLGFDSSGYIGMEYMHVLYGMSKDVAVGGLRLGCLYTRNEELWRAISAMSFLHWGGSGDEMIAMKIFQDQEWLDGFFEQNKRVLGDRSKLVRRLLDNKALRYHAKAKAGLFIWVDLRELLNVTGKEGAEAEMAILMMMVQHKVFVIPGTMMWNDEPGWFRIIFAQEEQVLTEGMKRFFEVVDKLMAML